MTFVVSCLCNFDYEYFLYGRNRYFTEIVAVFDNMDDAFKYACKKQLSMIQDVSELDEDDIFLLLSLSTNFSIDSPPYVKSEYCSYIFKSGQNTGLTCGVEIENPTKIFCAKHTHVTLEEITDWKSYYLTLHEIVSGMSCNYSQVTYVDHLNQEKANELNEQEEALNAVDKMMKQILKQDPRARN